MFKLFNIFILLFLTLGLSFGQAGKGLVYDEHGVPQITDIATEAELDALDALVPKLATANTYTGVNQQTFGGALVAEGIVTSGSNATNGGVRALQAGGSGAYVSLETASGKAGLLRSSLGHFAYYDTSTGDTVLDAVYSSGKVLIKEENSLIATLAMAAASTPGLHLSGSIFTGGTATTTKPLVLIEPTGATSNNWSTSGTLLGLNGATGFSGAILELQVNGSSRFRFSGAGSLTIYAGGLYFGTGQDAFILRDSAAILQMGADAASPVTQTFKGCDARAGTDTNTVGGILNIAAGRGTGTAAGGNLQLQTSVSTTTGTSAGSLTAREFYYGGEKSLTESSATTLVNIAFGSSKYIGGTLTATTHADDATDFQATTEHFTFSAVNKAGTVTAVMQATPSTSTTAASTGTLSTTWTIVNNGASIDIKNNAVSSLTQTTLKVSYKLTLNSDAATTITP